MDGFFGIGLAELFLIAVVALVVLGPERLPGALREVAKFIRTIRNLTNELTSQFGDEFKVLEDLNPQKILRELAEDPDEKAKAATKPGAKTPAKPAATKPITTKPATKPATSTTSKPATTKPATTSTTATAAKSTAAKPAATTPKPAGTATTSKPSTVAKPATEGAVATAEGEAEAVGEAVTAQADLPETETIVRPGVMVFDSPHTLVEEIESDVAEVAVTESTAIETGQDALAVSEPEPSILPPARREAPLGTIDEINDVEEGQQVEEPQAEAELPVEAAAPDKGIIEVALDGEATELGTEEAVDVDGENAVVTAGLNALDAPETQVEDDSAGLDESGILSGEAAIASDPPQVKAKSANGNHATVTEDRVPGSAHVNGNSTESEP